MFCFARNYRCEAKCESKLGVAGCHQLGKPENESADNPEEYAEIIVREFRHSLRVGVNKGTTGLPWGSIKFSQ